MCSLIVGGVPQTARWCAALWVSALVLLSGCARDPAPYISKYDPVLANAPFPAIAAGPGRSDPLVAIFGDNQASGAACSSSRSYPEILGDALGWAVEANIVVDGGYLSSGSGRMAERISNFPMSTVGTPDLFVLQAGASDVGSLSGDLVVAVQDSIRTVREIAPGVPVVVVGLLWGNGFMSEDASRNYVDIARVALGAKGVGFVNTYDLRFAQDPVSGAPVDDGCVTLASAVEAYLRSLHVVSDR